VDLPFDINLLQTYQPIGRVAKIDLPSGMRRARPISDFEEHILRCAFDILLWDIAAERRDLLSHSDHRVRLAGFSGKHYEPTWIKCFVKPQETAIDKPYGIARREAAQLIECILDGFRQDLMIEGVISSIFHCEVWGGLGSPSHHDLMRLESFVYSLSEGMST
jgi:hypothetical protein